MNKLQLNNNIERSLTKAKNGSMLLCVQDNINGNDTSKCIL